MTAIPNARRFFFWFQIIWCVGTCHLAKAAAVERDLGEGLKYLRVHVLPADLPAAEVKAGPIVLDLRFTLAESDAATSLKGWLQARATEKTPVFVLINADTALALRNQFKELEDLPGVISIGRSSPEVTPDIEIETNATQERAAYEALEKNTAVDALVRENTGKSRIDEASIMQARAEETDGPDEFFAPARPKPDDTKPDSPPPALIDRALQRAIQLHRALLALKRL